MWFNFGGNSVKIKQTPLRCVCVFFCVWVFANLESFNDRYFMRHKRETRFLYTQKWLLFLFFVRSSLILVVLKGSRHHAFFYSLQKLFAYIGLISSRLVVKHIPFERKKSFDMCSYGVEKRQTRMKQTRRKSTRKKTEKEDEAFGGDEWKWTFVVIYSRASERFLELNRAHILSRDCKMCNNRHGESDAYPKTDDLFI